MVIDGVVVRGVVGVSDVVSVTGGESFVGTAPPATAALVPTEPSSVVVVRSGRLVVLLFCPALVLAGKAGGANRGWNVLGGGTAADDEPAGVADAAGASVTTLL